MYLIAKISNNNLQKTLSLVKKININLNRLIYI